MARLSTAPHDLRPPATVYHGTDADFDEFDVDNCLGGHFGTLAAARHRLRDTGTERIKYLAYVGDDGWMVREDNGSSRNCFEHGPFASKRHANLFVDSAPRLREPLAFELDAYRPLWLPDLGVWEFQAVTHALRLHYGEWFRDDAVHAGWNRSNAAGWEAVKRCVESAGFDSIAYRNETEDAHQLSWIVMRSERIHHKWRYFGPEQAHLALARAQNRRDLLEEARQSEEGPCARERMRA